MPRFRTASRVLAATCLCVFSSAVSAQDGAEPTAPTPAAATPTSDAKPESAEASPVVDTPDASAAPASSGPAPSDVTAVAAESPSVPESTQHLSPAAYSLAVCLIGDSPGVNESDVATSAALVCDALRDQGARVDSTPRKAAPEDARSAYRVSLRALGNLRILHVTHEAPIGTQQPGRDSVL